MEKIGLRPPIASDGLVKSQQVGGHRANWIWPHPNLSSTCILGICRRKPKRGDDPTQMKSRDLLWKQWIARDQIDGNNRGFIFHPRREQIKCYVAVWAVVDLGFKTLVSDPLVLGRLV